MNAWEPSQQLYTSLTVHIIHLRRELPHNPKEHLRDLQPVLLESLSLHPPPATQGTGTLEGMVEDIWPHLMNMETMKSVVGMEEVAE
jgi:hypothetical protein